MGGAFGEKEFILPGSAQNPIRRDPLAGGSLMGARSVRKSLFCRDQRKIPEGRNLIRRDPLAGGFLMSNLTRRDQRQWEDPLWAVRSVRKSPLCLEQRKMKAKK